MKLLCMYNSLSLYCSVFLVLHLPLTLVGGISGQDQLAAITLYYDFCHNCCN